MLSYATFLTGHSVQRPIDLLSPGYDEDVQIGAWDLAFDS